MTEINLLVESIKVQIVERDIILNLKPHLDRLFKSIRELGFSAEHPSNIHTQASIFLQDYFSSRQEPAQKTNLSRGEHNNALGDLMTGLIYKLRLLYGRDANFDFEIQPYERDLNKVFRIEILRPEEFHVNSQDRRFQHKFLPRPSMPKHSCDELIWLNEKGHICEGSFTNIFWRNKNQSFRTPHLDCNILPGTMREKFINDLRQEGKDIEEGFFSVEELLSAEEIFLTNALIGVKTASLSQQI